MINVYKLDEVYLGIECEKDVCYEIKDYFSCYAPNYKFHPKFRARIWDGRISFFDSRSQTLPIGLLSDLISFFESKDYEYNFQFPVSDLFDEDLNEEMVKNYLEDLFSDSEMKPYDYQFEAIFNALKNKRGIIESPTGSGKSLIIYSIIRFLLNVVDKKILLVVPNVMLVEQMFSDFFDYGWENVEEYVDILYSGKKIEGKPILVSTWQSIYQKGDEFFSKFDAILMDECHGLGVDSKSLKSIMMKCKSAKYRIGLTGTLPDEDIDNFTVYGFIGPKIFELKSSELIDRGILSQIVIGNIFYKYPEQIIQKYKTRTFPEEERLVESHKNRFKVLQFIFNQIRDGDNVLILCKHIEHLKAIEKFLIENLDDKYKVSVIYGEIGAKDREALRETMEKESNMILIGTFATMSTGVNIKKIHHVIFASSYKSKIKVLQSIGRGLRLHDSKDKMILWDIIDDLRWTKRTGKVENNYLFDHFIERLRYYDDQGFEYHNLQIDDSDLNF